MPNPIADPFVEVPDTDATSKLVLLEATPEGAVTVTMHRGAKKNAFNAELIGALFVGLWLLLFERHHNFGALFHQFGTGAGQGRQVQADRVDRCGVGQAAHLGRHHLRRSHPPVQRHLVDNEPR